MSLQPRYSKEEHAQRGAALYEQFVRPQVEAGNHGKVVALDVDTGTFEVAVDSLTTSRRLLVHHPDAQIWCVASATRLSITSAPGRGWCEHDGWDRQHGLGSSAPADCPQCPPLGSSPGPAQSGHPSPCPWTLEVVERSEHLSLSHIVRVEQL